MKTFVSALTLGLILAFSAPAFAGTAGGDTSVSKSAPAPKDGKAKTAESKASKPQEKKPMY